MDVFTVFFFRIPKNSYIYVVYRIMTLTQSDWDIYLWMKSALARRTSSNTKEFYSYNFATVLTSIALKKVKKNPHQ